jgi:hypothetical protein
MLWKPRRSNPEEQKKEALPRVVNFLHLEMLKNAKPTKVSAILQLSTIGCDQNKARGTFRECRKGLISPVPFNPLNTFET